MSARIQRFKPGDLVVVAPHSPLDTVGHVLVVVHVYPDRMEHALTGGAPYTARYKLADAAEVEKEWTTRVYELWDWMLEPAGSAPAIKPDDEPAQMATDSV